MAERLSAATGRQVGSVDVPADTFGQALAGAGLPGWLVERLVELNIMMADGHAAGVTDEVARLIGRQPRTFAQFAAEHRVAFGGQQGHRPAVARLPPGFGRGLRADPDSRASRVGPSLWGAQRRSCSWPVFVKQTAEQIASTNLARLLLADNRQPGRSVRCSSPSARCGRCRLSCST